MQKARKNIPENIYSILQKVDRSISEVEQLLEYIQTLEDLANYTADLSKRALHQLALNFYLEEFTPGQEVFHKGANSDKLYIILRGHLNMIDITSDGSEKLIATLPKGKMIGERGLIRDQPRQLSAVAKGYVILLALNGDKFKSLMMMNVSAELNDKVEFLNIYIPDFKLYSNSIREKIAYAFELTECHKKDLIVEEGSFSEALFYIVDGECVLSKGLPPKRRNIMTVGRGCSIADECVLLGKRAEFTVSVWTECARFYKAKRADILPLIPEEVMFKLVGLSKTKFISRNNVNDRARLQTKSRSGKRTQNFPLASQRAQKLITQTLSRNSSIHMISTPLNDSPTNYYKNTLEKLRDITIERFYKFNFKTSNSLAEHHTIRGRFSHRNSL